MVLSDNFSSKLEEQTGIQFEDDSIDLPDNQPATASLVDFVQFLFEQNYLNEDELPIQSGWTRYLLNTEPVHSEGDEMTRSEEVTPGVYLEKNFNKDGIKRQMKYLYRSIEDESN